MAFKLFVCLLLLFVIGNFIYFLKSQVNYSFHLRTLRKGLYSLFIGAVGLGVLFDEINLTNWQFILTLTTIIIFIDLAILLTPSILKIFSAEFQYADYVENIIMTNDKREKATLERVNTMSEMIQLAEEDFKQDPYLDDVLLDETVELEQYLQRYSEQFGFIIQIFNFDYSPFPISEIPSKDKSGLNDEELELLSEQLGFVNGIEKCLNKIERLNSFNLEENRQSYIEALANLKIVSLLKDDSMIVPVDMEIRQYLIVLKNQKGVLLEVDAVHIINLIHIFYIYKKDSYMKLYTHALSN
ncbi:Type II toxin-antitoxin system toxin SpoIISA OS=Ureibacillus acetophenoni OX=614649 GN=SAMN05877842_1219 PE=4 SV=1 [Ureibacillus acetophenoni]